MQKITSYIKESLKTHYPESEILGFVRIIIEHITGRAYSLAISGNDDLSNQQQQALEQIIARLKQYEPIQYITGETEFFGLPFSVDANVLIPRPETEELVELILNENPYPGLNVLDIGTGSGAIAVALAKYMKEAKIAAWDISDGALETAKNNAERNGVNVFFQKVDVLATYPTVEKYDIIVSNPPYIMESEKAQMERNVLDYEPDLALFVPDDDALLFYEHIAGIALNILKQGGRLYFEINREKGRETLKMLEKKGFFNIALFQDLSKNDRMVRAVLSDRNNVEE